MVETYDLKNANEGYQAKILVQVAGEDNNDNPKDEGYRNKQKDEKELREFLDRGKISVRHARGIIVGCGGAGKTTLLNRLANADYNVLENIEPTDYLDVHVNKFVLKKDGHMIPSNFFLWYYIYFLFKIKLRSFI